MPTVMSTSLKSNRGIEDAFPPHLVPKWKREVEMTVPGARAVVVKSITDLERLRLSIGSGPLFAVMSREKAKLSYRWMPAVIERWAVSKRRLVRDEETGEPFRVPCCPDCTAQIVDKDGVPLTDEDLNRRKHTCAGCGAPHLGTRRDSGTCRSRPPTRSAWGSTTTMASGSLPSAFSIILWTTMGT